MIVTIWEGLSNVIVTIWEGLCNALRSVWGIPTRTAPALPTPVAAAVAPVADIKWGAALNAFLSIGDRCRYCRRSDGKESDGRCKCCGAPTRGPIPR